MINIPPIPGTRAEEGKSAEQIYHILTNLQNSPIIGAKPVGENASFSRKIVEGIEILLFEENQQLQQDSPDVTQATPLTTEELPEDTPPEKRQQILAEIAFAREKTAQVIEVIKTNFFNSEDPFSEVIIPLLKAFTLGSGKPFHEAKDEKEERALKNERDHGALYVLAKLIISFYNQEDDLLRFNPYCFLDYAQEALLSIIDPQIRHAYIMFLVAISETTYLQNNQFVPIPFNEEDDHIFKGFKIDSLIPGSRFTPSERCRLFLQKDEEVKEKSESLNNAVGIRFAEALPDIKTYLAKKRQIFITPEEISQTRDDGNERSQTGDGPDIENVNGLFDKFDLSYIYFYNDPNNQGSVAVMIGFRSGFCFRASLDNPRDLRAGWASSLAEEFSFPSTEYVQDLSTFLWATLIDLTTCDSIKHSKGSAERAQTDEKLYARAPGPLITTLDRIMRHASSADPAKGTEFKKIPDGVPVTRMVDELVQGDKITWQTGEVYPGSVKGGASTLSLLKALEHHIPFGSGDKYYSCKGIQFEKPSTKDDQKKHPKKK